ncbi:GntR family transcriptional regulator [Blastococcus sp. TF02A-26]|uniref:GntR family transcriptional regulator n=1 Tax=Blastococcus sp. TF02A-26 TaxID=2250577 RepID=UPI000DEAEC80|nr:GntR family transcriptional regulator [Blastococcus sp. TF02A-26]RBY86811.1 GntR family transcriptional regulator [Blastococcus sp. TF02A-26]
MAEQGVVPFAQAAQTQGGEDAIGGSLADTAYRQLRRSVLSGQRPPGSPLSVSALARDMGLSRSPVREAVQRLIHDGLATHVPHRGAQVVELDRRELMEIYEVKEPLEALASRLATARFSQADVERLEAMLVEQDRAVAGPVLAEESTLMELDRAFHSYIHRAAGNRVLCDTLAAWSSRTNLAFPSGWANPEYARLSVAEHHDIARAITSGDADEAERVTARHVRLVRTRLARWQARQAQDRAAGGVA